MEQGESTETTPAGPRLWARRTIGFLLLLPIGFTLDLLAQELIFKDGFEISGENLPPVVVSTPVTEASVGQPYVYDVNATDPNGDPILYALVGQPAGMTITQATGLVQWTPSAAGLFPVTVYVSDGIEVVEHSWTITVSINQAPVITTNAITDVQVGDAYSYDVHAIDPEADEVTYQLKQSPPGMSINSGTGEILWSAATAGDYPVVVEASALGGIDEQAWSIHVLDGLPPEPVPDGISPYVPTTFPTNVEFLYEGPDAIQIGVEEDAFEAHRVSVVRGVVTDRDGTPLAGAKISALRDKPIGYTLTRADGAYDLVINGGGEVLIQVEKTGYLVAQRNPQVPWNDFRVLDPIRLVALSPVVTTIDLESTAPLVARGIVEADTDGSRQGTLFFQPGTVAEMHFRGGGKQTISTMDVRITEFTVGENGPEAMPAGLPPTTGYTYAAEYSVDEANALGAETVTFDPPAVTYLENFLEFPVGTAVPMGGYNRQEGEWEASPDGRVLEIVSVTADMADLDVDGDGVADDLADLGITDAERTELASLYPVGQQFWRVEVPHFSPWDCNWPYDIPVGARPPNVGDGPRDNAPEPEKDCESKGFSTVDCHSQVLKEAISVAGTQQALHYRSDRAPGYEARRSLEVVIPAEDIPEVATDVIMILEVAGSRFEQLFSGDDDIETVFEWDGNDAWGRPVAGAQPYSLTIGYGYSAVYAVGSTGGEGADGGGSAARARTFFMQPGVTLDVNRSNLRIVMKRKYAGYLSYRAADIAGLGDWTVSDQHSFQRNAGILDLGYGDRRGGVRKLDPNVVLTPYKCLPLSSCPLGPVAGELVTDRHVQAISSAALSDGSIVFTHSFVDGITAGLWRIGTGGELSLVAEQTGSMVTAMPDNDVLIVQAGDGQSIVRVGLDGAVKQVFGGGSIPLQFNLGYVGPADELFVDDGAAIRISSLAAAPDGSFYVGVIDGGARATIWHVSPDGIAQRIAGLYSGGNTAVTVQAITAEVSSASGLAVSNNGDVWVSERNAHRVRRISAGTIQPALGTGNCNTDWEAEGPATETNLCFPQLLTFSPDGLLYISSHYANSNARRLFQFDGRQIRLIAGGLVGLGARHGEFALGGRIGNIANNLFTLADGTIVIQEGTGTQQTIFIQPRFKNQAGSASSVFQPSSDGRLVYEFDNNGRHLQTIDTFLQRTIRTFGYDPAGRLTSITNADGRVTTIQRNGSGMATSITGPDGHQTQLTMAGGVLTEITNPANEVWSLDYDPNDLLTSATDPRGHASSYIYGDLGRLEQATSRAGGVMTLSRTTLGSNAFEVAITTHGNETVVHRVEPEGLGMKRTLIDPTGATTVVTVGADGVTTGVFPDGTEARYELTSDPRFDGAASYLSRSVVLTPQGSSTVQTVSAEAVLADLLDPFSMTHWNETQTLDGEVTTFEYDVANRTLTRTSSEGRVQTETYDNAGRLLSIAPAGNLSPIVYSYTVEGRVNTVTHGAESLTMAYDADGNLISSTDQDNNVTTWTYDAVGRVHSAQFPSGRTYEYTLDENGNRTAIEMPESQVHTLVHDENDILASYTLPTSAPLELFYDGLGRREGVMYPDTTQRDDQFVNGQLSASVLPEALLSLGRLAEVDDGPGTTRQIDFLSRDPDSRPQQSTTRTLDGRLVLAETHAGPAAATVSYSYNHPYQVASRTLNSESPVAFSYDGDGLLTGAGPFTISRESATGLQALISDGTLELETILDDRAQLARRELVHGASTRFMLEVTRDSHARIENIIENIGGAITELNYEYDSDGQLIAVTDGSNNPVESFNYDGNGNRTSHTLLGDTRAASYDDQDRIVSRNGIGYTYDANGFLASRGADTFLYAADGGLMTAMANGETVTYDHDYLGRRVARTDSGGTTSYSYGDLAHPFRITASIAPDATVSEYFHDDAGHLFALVRDGDWYYVGTDPVGSPVVIVDATSGSIVRSISYSAFGEVLGDTNPGFVIPAGFAGGLADPETDLVRFGLRDYEPIAGRFTARDPVLQAGGSPNLYAYVLNDPVNFRDLTGLFFKIGGSAYGGLGGGFSITVTSHGVGVCGELGAGLGGGLSLEPVFGDVPDAGLSAVGAIGIGPLGTGVEVPFNDCWASGRPQFNFDGFSGSDEGVNNAADGVMRSAFDLADRRSAEIFKTVASKMGKVKAEASIGVRACLPPLTF